MKDTLYYDGACPLCAAEMAKLSRYTGDQLVLENIHSLDDQGGLPDKQVLLKRLHLRTADGQWLVGIDANIRAWHYTPYGRFWRILGWPLIKPFSMAAYELWLVWRQRRPAQCVQKPPKK